jgi:hypothetical protein
MALEYIYDAIRATAGEDTGISATILDDDGNPFETGCGLSLYDGDGERIGFIDGYYVGEGLWLFTIPAHMNYGLSGRYYYSINQDGEDMNFKTPIYFE